MRQLLLHCLMLLVAINGQAQQVENSSKRRTPIEHVVDFGNRLPHEKVYLHLDNICYFMGDTIWYKAYVTRSDNNRPSDISKLLYVELLTPDGYLVERQQIPISTTGNGFGAFELKDTLYSGYYELRAYTRWQLNFGLYEHESAYGTKNRFYDKKMAEAFFRDYDKLYSRVIPVYDKPKEEGEFSKLMTTRPLRRYYSKDKTKEELRINFFPEGGDLIEGVKSRVAFECVDEEGKHVATKGIILNRAGEEVAQFSTSFRGRGVIELPASELDDQAFTAVVQQKEKRQTYKLPEVRKAGCAIRIDEEGEHIQVQLTTRKLEAESATTLQATVMCGGKVSALMSFELDEKGEATQLIPKERLRTGVNQITLVDAKGEIFADRLFFINHHEYKQHQLIVSGLKKEYAPYEAIELDLQLTGENECAEISIAIRDEATDEGSFDDSNILTEMLLSSEIKGFIENPAYYFESDDKERKAHLDLLLMVQGWRRYVWRDMAGINGFGLSHFPEKFQTLEGSVHRLHLQAESQEDADNPNADLAQNSNSNQNTESQTPPVSTLPDLPTAVSSFSESSQTGTTTAAQQDFSLLRTNLKKEVEVVAEFVLDGELEINDQTTTNGFFKLMVPPYFGHSITFLSGNKIDEKKKAEEEANPEAATEKKKKRRRIHLEATREDEQGIPEYYVKRDLFFPRFVKPYSYYQEQVPEEVFRSYGTGVSTSLNEMQWLDQVNIHTRRGGLRKVDYSKPAFVIDAYEMYNHVVDWGLAANHFPGGTRSVGSFFDQVAFALCADMGRLRNYTVSMRINDKLLTGRMGVEPSHFGDGEMHKNFRLRRMDKIYVYTDYEPRHEGSWKYDGDDQPEVVVKIKLFDDDAVQPTYRDRRYILPGFAECAQFYSPDYSQTALPEVKDYRRTLYWNPVVKVNSEGKSTLKLYNNAKQTRIKVSAEGITPSGLPVLMPY